MVVLSPDFYRMVDGVYNDCSSEELISEILVNLLTCDEVRCNTDHTFFPESIFSVESLSSSDIRERQERSSAVMIHFQKFDEILCRTLIVCNDITYTSAESCLDCDLIFLLRCDQVGDNAVDAGISPLLLHDLFDCVAIALIVLIDRTQRIKS